LTVYHLKILPEAREELRNELSYSKKRWGIEHSRKYGQEIRTQIGMLQKNPRLYPLRQDVLPGIRIKTFKGNRIIYTICEDHGLVVILAVLSAYKNINKDMLKQRRRTVK
jgi:plasmid stabilization system protein ParE